MQTLSKNDPESIGPFTLVARLGAGGMGVVYLATRGNQSVALKVLNTALTENSVARSRFKKEIQTLQQIESPFVAKVVDAHADAETAWLAVEFVNGPDLKALVDDKGPLPLDQWITLADGLLSGIRAIHAVGVIHRDIKPGNILISETGPKIIDFGISQDLDATSLTTTGLMAGSPAWLSPEQIDGAKLTSATDIFSAGSVLHFAASGVSPWGNQNTSTTSAIFNNILSKTPNTSKTTELQRGLIEALLEKEVKSRPSASRAIKILESFGEDSPKAQIVSSVKKTRPRNLARKFPSRVQEIFTNRKLIKQASTVVVVGSLLSAIIFLFSPVQNILPKFACAETYYASGDLSTSSYSELEDTAFLNITSRDCKPLSNLDEKLSYEHCIIRNPSVPSAYGEIFKSVLLSRSETLSIDHPFIQSDNQDGLFRYGCRSYVELGMMTEYQSKLDSIGFSFESGVPLLAEDGSMNLGESRYKLMFDGNSGTFITRFYPSNQDEKSISLTQSAFRKIEVDSIDYVAGYIIGDLWRTYRGELRAEIVLCIDPEWDKSLVESGQIPLLEARMDGEWIPAGEVEWVAGTCGQDLRSIKGVISDTVFMSMAPNGTCNPVRLDLPEVPISTRAILEYCLYIKES